MKIKNTIILLILSSIIFSCTGAKDALQGKKRSEQSDEFLVEKKNPLELPPDFDDMPVPIEQEENIQRSNDDDLKEILDINTNQSNNDQSSDKSLEESILKKINIDENFKD
jgi:hypothetical protein|tara:strand:+ start:854 stop:1186 length:333 start_codon:yes stop_codon:yes gene_type:complete